MSSRIDVRKTYKLFIGGKFPRSESGRSYRPEDAPEINVARASRKDLRDAVAAARGAATGFAKLTHYNRGQLLYRMAEHLEARRDSLAVETAVGLGGDLDAAEREVEAAIDTLTWYAGVPDKLQSLLGSQNAVSGPFFNFSTVEPAGVVFVAAPARPCLAGLIALLAPVLAGGNAAVCLVSPRAPLAGLGLGELIAVSDVPGGVVNLLAGDAGELLPHAASHRDVDGLLLAGAPDVAISSAAADSVTRVRFANLAEADWLRAPRGVGWVEPFVEVKTLWHPVAP